MKQNKIFLLISFSVGIAVCITKFIGPTIKLDGVSGVFNSLLLATDDSKYSNGYSNEKFLTIKKGMTVEEVFDILGQPIRADKNGNEYYMLWYSWSPKSTHYRRRNIIIKNQKVDLVNSEYWID